ncbi:MAG TPA: hypothetical protein VK669_02725 [Candidatus Limnocylindrales bacterium]|nr:hypothetical protein [Candidatus Limnocylindrales bacterium]
MLRSFIVALLLPALVVLFARAYQPPKWTMSVSVETTAVNDEAAALRSEQRIARAVALQAERHGLKPRLLNETTARGGFMARTVVARRVVSIESDDEDRLNGFAAHFAMHDAEATLPRRNFRVEDLGVGLLLIAMVLGFATFERSAAWNSDPMTLQPGRAAVVVLALGIVAAAGAIADIPGARLGMAVFVLLAFLPAVAWLVKMRATWIAVPRLARVHTTIAAFAAVVALEWTARLLR